jgi:hypothetical protein
VNQNEIKGLGIIQSAKKVSSRECTERLSPQMFSPRLHLSSAVKLTLQMSMQRLPIAGEMSQG